MKSYWICVSIISFAIGGCCGSAICDEPTLQAAKSQLNAVKNPLDAIKELTENTSAVETEEAKNDTPLPTPADVVLPVVTFQKSVSGSSDGLVRTKSTITEYWLVSEPWCLACSAAKNRFRDAGRPEKNIISIADARRLHGKKISSVPAEYTTNEVREVVNPPTYREQQVMQVTLNGSSKPLRESILSHLRGGGPHQGKHWQSWHLESWRTPQLYALHDDDHKGIVPSFEPEQQVIANVENGVASPELFAAVLAAHIMESSGQETDASPIVMGSLFDFTIEVDQSWKLFAQKILRQQKIEFPAAGLSIDWSGSTRSFSIAPNAITITPPVKATVKKWVFQYSVGLNGVSFADDLGSVKVDLSGAPDVTINLVSRP